MADSFTEVSRQGYFSRIGSSIKGVFFGIILFFAAVALLWWNEGRAVKTATGINQAAEVVVSVEPNQLQPEKETALVHFCGIAETSERLADPDFGIEEDVLKLSRTVEMYQWVEDVQTKKVKKTGGTEETVTHYEYFKKWSSSLQETAKFKHGQGHENPPSFPVPSIIKRASQVRVGAFILSEEFSRQISNSVDLSLEKMREIAANNQGVFQDNHIYFGSADVSEPRIGDYRVKWSLVHEQPVCAVGKQSGQQLVAYFTDNEHRVAMLSSGSHTAEEMFESARQSNTILTWVLRVVGFFLVFLAWKILFAPVAVVADVIPLVGNIFRLGTGLVAFVLAVFFSSLVIAISWIIHRPILGIALLIIAIGAVLLARKMASNREPAQQDQFKGA